jgi:short-subunit dehydrogenase
MNASTFRSAYGSWALITGASDGIGKAFAEQVAALGLNVVLVARRLDRLEALATALRAQHGIEAIALAADVSSEQGLADIEGATASLDVGLLVAAAGYGTSGPFLAADLARERDMLAVNAYAVLRQCMTFGNRFVARGRGGIILMSSIVGWQGVPRSTHYAATKAYVQSLAEGLRLELRPHGVDVLAAAPGPVESGFATRAGMRMRMTVLPATVAKESLAALGRRGTVIPGGLSKLMTYALASLPRTLRTRVLARVMGNMTKHQLTVSVQS